MPEIWVYGTLRQGMPADMLMRGARFRGLGWLNRVQLADLGTYPGLIEGGPGVLGELYQVTPRHLKALDQYEDCFPDRPDASLYFRRSVRVRRLADGQPVTVDAYFYALKRPAPRVEVPCYRVHCHPRDSLQYLLCYGSNMSRKRLEDRVVRCRTCVQPGCPATGWPSTRRPSTATEPSPMRSGPVAPKIVCPCALPP
ncbi:gamma-glutamylcyclotransferase family protein [Hahella sp. SMD15-11]|uniref:Gamma-glutamylcyclotransferase family protein n=1 Tax=Thermohahella caldifontis TaxID=3142973 RepID=A0AB39UUF6_9GAMM